MSARARFVDRYPAYSEKSLIPGASLRRYKRQSNKRERAAVGDLLRRGREIPPRHRSILYEVL